MSRKPWTAEDDATLCEMYANRKPRAAIARRLGRTVEAVYRRAYQLDVTDRGYQAVAVVNATAPSRAYSSGGAARRHGHAITSCTLDNPAMRSWWLAGYHDADMAMGNRVTAGRTEVRA